MKNTAADKSNFDNKRKPIAQLLLTKHLPVGLAIGIKRSRSPLSQAAFSSGLVMSQSGRYFFDTSRRSCRSSSMVDGQDSAVAIRSCFQFPSSFQLSPSLGKLSAARSIASRVLLRASQASDVGSIPIARSITPDDSTTLTRLGAWKTP
jgi:hypothetical protein